MDVISKNQPIDILWIVRAAQRNSCTKSKTKRKKKIRLSGKNRILFWFRTWWQFHIHKVKTSFCFTSSRQQQVLSETWKGAMPSNRHRTGSQRWIRQTITFQECTLNKNKKAQTCGEQKRISWHFLRFLMFLFMGGFILLKPGNPVSLNDYWLQSQTEYFDSLESWSKAAKWCCVFARPLHRHSSWSSSEGARQNVDLWYFVTFSVHHSSDRSWWCDGVIRHLLWTAHLSAFHWCISSEQAMQRRDQLLFPLLNSIVWPSYKILPTCTLPEHEGSSVDRRDFPSSLAPIFNRHVTHQTPLGCFV